VIQKAPSRKKSLGIPSQTGFSVAAARLLIAHPRGRHRIEQEWPVFLHIVLATWLTASAADGVTTFMAVNAGAHELNPLVKTPELMAVEKATIGMAGVLVAHRWEKQHPKLVKVFAIAATVGYSALAVHNYQVYQEQRHRQ
jgi:hypothetical protein